MGCSTVNFTILPFNNAVNELLLMRLVGFVNSNMYISYSERGYCSKYLTKQ